MESVTLSGSGATPTHDPVSEFGPARRAVHSAHWRRAAALLLLSACATAPAAPQAPVEVGWERVPTPHLPSSIQLFRSSGTLSDGQPVSGWYASVDLTDPQVTIQATFVGEGGTRITPLQEMQQTEGTPYLAVNGTFFSQTTSVSPVVDRGEVLVYGRQEIVRQGRSYPATWGAWGMDASGRSEVVWSWSEPTRGEILAFDQPWPVRLGGPELPRPALELDGLPGGRVWEPVVAMGGTPVLMKDGRIIDLGEDPDDPGSIVNTGELVNYGGLTGRHPRTAIGVMPDRTTLVLMVVDGRQPGFSVGVTLQELGSMMAAIGVHEALNIDGGGSTAFIAENGDGVFDGDDVLSSPSDASGMRPVATSLLIRATAGSR